MSLCFPKYPFSVSFLGLNDIIVLRVDLRASNVPNKSLAKNFIPLPIKRADNSNRPMIVHSFHSCTQTSANRFRANIVTILYVQILLFKNNKMFIRQIMRSFDIFSFAKCTYLPDKLARKIIRSQLVINE